MADSNGKSKSDKSDTIQENPEVLNSKLDVAQVSNNNPGPFDSNEYPGVNSKRPQESNILISDFLTALSGCSREASLEINSDDLKTELIADMVKNIRDLQGKVKEQKEWAQRKVMDSASRLSKDFLELQMLRTTKVGKEKIENKKDTPEKPLVLQLTEEYLEHVNGQASLITNAVKKLDMKNAQIRADIEAFKLSGSESERDLQEVLKREKKCMKKLADVEKQSNILRSLCEEEKLRGLQLKQDLLQAEKEADQAETQWREEIKEKEHILALMAEESKNVETQKASSRTELLKLRQKVETDREVAEDECRRLEEELTNLRKSGPLADLLPDNLSFLYNFDEATSSESSEASEKMFRRWICLKCMKNEVSVVFLPCTHQVLCFRCYERHCRAVGGQCPYCHAEIEESIKVYGPSA